METKRSKIILFCAAGALLIIALVWNIRLNSTSEGSRLCRTLNEYGYTLHPDDLYPSGAWNDTSIRTLLPDIALNDAVAASKSARFPSDIDRIGHITLLMANIGSDDVITLYLIDGEIELGFVQTKGTQTVRALGEQ